MVDGFHVSSDAQLNHELQAELGSLRGGVVAAAERLSIPERFTFEPHPDRPAMILKDKQTKRTSVVRLCHYLGVRETLADLFG